ncbi:MAG: type II toxin-antitoxin system VapC family toxin [Nitrospinae bacterium]|nr:type II toxin-antitoxin system VapC family toxin [Nitrospinota bacterium]
MLYFDTSFVAPLLMQEETSVKVERFFARLKAGELAVSQWTLVEFSSLLAREVRMGGLESGAAARIDNEFISLIGASFVILPVDGRDFRLARSFVQKYASGLRAGDALHLAVCSNNKVKTVYSLDKRFVEAGRMLSLPTSHGI